MRTWLLCVLILLLTSVVLTKETKEEDKKEKQVEKEEKPNDTKKKEEKKKDEKKTSKNETTATAPKKEEPIPRTPMEAALLACNKVCTCSDVPRSIECNSMKKLWTIVTDLSLYVEQFSNFYVKVSDRRIRRIVHNFKLEEGAPNALRQVKGLTLGVFTSLRLIDDMFFEKHFPNLEFLTVSESENQLSELTIGKLPRLKELQVNGHNIGKITGCLDSYQYCFEPDRMNLLELPTLNLYNMDLPQYITEIKIELNNATNKTGDADVFENKIVDYLKFIPGDLKNFPKQFSHLDIVEEFYFEIFPMKDEELWSLMIDIHHQPELIARMKLRINNDGNTTAMKFPLMMTSCANCDFDETSHIADDEGTCFEEQKYLDTFNPDLPEDYQKNTNLTIRGIFVDIENIIQVLNGDSTFHVTIYAFVAKVPQTTYVNFNLKVYYVILQNHQAELSQSVSLQKPYTEFRFEERFGAPLHYAKKVDGLFVHQYSLCITKLTTKFMRNSPDDRFTSSLPWRMYLNLPNTGIYATSNEALVNSRTSAMQSLLTKYMYMFAEEENSMKSLPYSTVELQKELAQILIKSSDEILFTKLNFQTRKPLGQIGKQDAATLKTILDSEDEKQIKFLQGEQIQAMALADIAFRQKELQEDSLKRVKGALKDVVLTYADMEKHLEARSQAFTDGAIKRKATEIADIGADLTAAIISVMNIGDFDYSEVAKKYAKQSTKRMSKLLKITQLMEQIQNMMDEMKRMSVIFNKVNKIFRIKYEMLKKVFKKIADKRTTQPSIEKANYAGLLKRMSKGLSNIQDIAESVLALYRDTGLNYDFDSDPTVGFLQTEEFNMIITAYNVKSDNDVTKWDVVEEEIHSLFSEDLLTLVPESSEYKGALVNMITRGKSITQLQLDQTKLMADITFSDKNYWQFIELYAALYNRIDDIDKSKSLRQQHNSEQRAQREYIEHYQKAEKDIYYTIFINKLQMIDARNDFCNGYYYYHLKDCPKLYDIDMFTPLGDARDKYKQLVLENSIRDPQNFNYPPQKFEDLAVLIKKEDNCQCVLAPYQKLKEIDPERNATAEERSRFESESKLACYPNYNGEVPDNAVLEKLDRCNTALLDNLIKYNTITIEIPVNYGKQFANYERVRIEEVEVRLDGVKTDDGKVVMKIENPGMIQDRYDGRVFKFYGAPWMRSYEYCDKTVRKGAATNNEFNAVPTECFTSKHKTIVSTSTHQEFGGFYLKPSLFSTWIVTVPDHLNHGLDLLNINSLELNFRGSLIPGEINYSTYDVTGEPPRKSSEGKSEVHKKLEELVREATRGHGADSPVEDPIDGQSNLAPAHTLR